MDLNPNSLEVTSRRVHRYNPVIHRINILEPINLNLQKFDSWIKLFITLFTVKLPQNLLCLKIFSLYLIHVVSSLAQLF